MFILDDKLNNTYFTNHPPDPAFFFAPLEPTFIQPFIQQTPTPVNPPPTSPHVLHQKRKMGLEPHGAGAAYASSVLSGHQQQLLSLDDFGWFDTPSSSKVSFATHNASASASAPSVPATSDKSDASGFDQLSLFDDVCASAFNTPFTPYLDTPNQTPNQTPLFDCVASEDLDTTSLEQFWTVAAVSADNTDSHQVVSDAVATSAAAARQAGSSSLDLNLDLNLKLDFALGLTSPVSPDIATILPASTTQSGKKDAVVAAQDPSQFLNARLQAETALLDFVLFDDIAPSSPISTLSLTPATASQSPPFFVDSKAKQEIEDHELAMQLVVAAAASMANQSTSSSTAASAQGSPFESSDSSDIFGSLFSDVDFSPSMESASSTSPTSVTFSSPQQMSLDWMSMTPHLSPQNFSFDFNNNNNHHLNSVISNSSLGSVSTAGAFSMMQSSSPMLPVAVTSPQIDLGFLLSLYNQQQQQQQQALFSSFGMMPPMTSSSDQQPLSGQTTTTPTNPLKRKSDEIKEAGEDSQSRQFTCTQCGRAFSRLFNLNTHERTHDRSKARLFGCPEQGCKKSFTRKNDLQRHQVSIHGVTHIYGCPKRDCHKSFSRRDELRKHTELKDCAEDDEEYEKQQQHDHSAHSSD